MIIHYNPLGKGRDYHKNREFSFLFPKKHIKGEMHVLITNLLNKQNDQFVGSLLIKTINTKWP